MRDNPSLTVPHNIPVSEGYPALGKREGKTSRVYLIGDLHDDDNLLAGLLQHPPVILPH